MFSLHELLVYFLKAWADVCTYLMWRAQEVEYGPWPVDNYQWAVVILSVCFFYMFCYLIHKYIEDWIKIWKIRQSISKLIDYDDSST